MDIFFNMEIFFIEILINALKIVEKAISIFHTAFAIIDFKELKD